MIDANQMWDVPQAIDWVKALAEYDLHWIEEPTSPDDVLGHAAIRAAVAPIGDYIALTGTTENRFTEFVDHLHEHFADPCVVEDARYVMPSQPGYSAEILGDSIATYEFPGGLYWRREVA